MFLHESVSCRFFSLYHNAVSTRVKELASEDLEANEIVSLLTWVLNTYKRYTDPDTLLVALSVFTVFILETLRTSTTQ